MGNTHFKVFRTGENSIETFELSEVTYEAVLAEVCSVLKIPKKCLVTLYLEARGGYWLKFGPRDDLRHWTKAGSASNPILLRVDVLVPDPDPNPMVPFKIVDKECATLFELPREAVTIEALQAEAKARYPEFSSLTWDWDKTWVRLDNKKDVDYMFKLVGREKDGSMKLIRLNVFYTCEDDDKE
jgi:hypothetical protein